MFPDFVKKLKFENYGIEGVEIYSSHTPEGTFYFFSTKNEFVVPEHTHAAQWGNVLRGELTETRRKDI